MEPVPWKRAGCNFNRKVLFDQQKQEKLACGIHLVNQHANERKLNGPLQLHLLFVLPLATGHCRRSTHKKPEAIDGYHFHFYRPDLDNYIKWICDVMQTTGVIFNDDCQIVTIDAKKVFGDPPRTEIVIKEMKA